MTRIFTLGHSTRSAAEFVGLLSEHGITCLVDVRRFPGSRRHPHFAREALAGALRTVRIAYAHEPDLGGYRKLQGDSPNAAWRTAGFRAYADHMDTPQFRTALARVVERAEQSVTAIMCAEAVPWRCHRQLISDALVARGHDVVHILAPGKIETHTLSEHARALPNHRLVYPELPADQVGLFPENGG
ncbi:MAG: DUF488 domain-containing protein [Gemmatimonadota bacterium]